MIMLLFDDCLLSFVHYHVNFEQMLEQLGSFFHTDFWHVQSERKGFERAYSCVPMCAHVRVLALDPSAHAVQLWNIFLLHVQYFSNVTSSSLTEKAMQTSPRCKRCQALQFLLMRNND